MIIDAHTHVYPDKIAEKVSDVVGEFYDIKMRFTGDLRTLVGNCRKVGVDKCVIISVATTKAQVRTINSFLTETVKTGELPMVALCALHHEMTESEIADELDFAEKNGMRGIKLHPDFQKFAIDDRVAYKIYEAAQGRFPILFHTGDSRYEFSQPFRLKRVMRDFPGLVAIGAHFGGWSEWDDATRELAGQPNLFVDTSSSLYLFSDEQARKAISAFGAENVMFGSDFPMWDAGEEIRRLSQIGLSERETELIMYKNAQSLYFEPK